MPHQCVRCSKIYDDGSHELLKGCGCGGKFFFFIKAKDIEQAKAMTVNLTQEEKVQIELDIKDIISEDMDMETPVVLDLESIRVLKPGQYELDLVDLFRKRPLVYRLEDGKYFIDLASMFEAKDKEAKNQTA